MDLLRTLFYYFLFYSFLGWLLEGFFNLFTRGYFTKPNFLQAPIKPMYGIAAVILIELAPQLPPWLFLISCFVVPVGVEYLTALLLNHTFHLKYWDYSHKRLQLSGYICLRFAVYWSILSFLLVTYVHPYAAALYDTYSVLWFYSFPTLLLLFIADVIYSVWLKRVHAYENNKAR